MVESTAFAAFMTIFWTAPTYAPRLRAEGILLPRTHAATVVRVAYRAILEPMAGFVTVDTGDDAQRHKTSSFGRSQ